MKDKNAVYIFRQNCLRAGKECLREFCDNDDCDECEDCNKYTIADLESAKMELEKLEVKNSNDLYRQKVLKTIIEHFS